MSLDVALCLPKLTKLYNSWKSDRSIYDNADALVFIRGKASDEAGYSKSTSFQLWLFGYEVPEIVIVMTAKAIVMLTSTKKAAFLEPLQKAAAGSKLPPIEILVRSKADQDAANFETILKKIKESNDGKKIGLFVKEVASHVGPFASAFIKAAASFDKANSATGVGVVMAPKDQQDLIHVRAAARLSSDILHKRLRKQIIDVVDGDAENPPTHLKLAEDALSFFVPDAEGEKLKYMQKLNLEVGDVDSCYTPIVQSGNKFSLKVSALSNEDKLSLSGAIMCTLGARYNFHCTNVGRTYIFDPSDEQRKNYELLVLCYEAAIATMKPDIKISTTIEKVKAVLKDKKRPDLESHLPKTLGFCMTYEFRESALAISTKCSAKYEANMVFNLAVGFENLPYKGDSSKPYALQLVDTVLITDTGAEVLTPCAKKWDDIAWDLQGDDDDDNDNVEEDDNKNKLALKLLENESFAKGRRVKTEHDESSEQRKQKQKELEAKANEAAKRRLLNQADTDTDILKKKKVACYKHRRDLSSEDCQRLRIFVDRNRDAVILPIFGMPVPFHISTIKTCNKTEDEPRSFLRVVFDTPGVKLKREYELRGKGLVYLKELTFRSENDASIANACRLIKEMQKRYKTQLADKAERENFVAQEELIKNPKGTSTPALQNMFARPSTLSSRGRTSGTLEAHKNGFLWTSRKGDSSHQIKILYSRVRFAFYQPPDNELVILLHFHLKSGIMIGKKQHKDVQFYMEVGEVATDLSKRQSGYDRDELEQENQERIRRSKMKKAFQHFIDKVQNMTGNKLEFEVPQTDLGFNGVPGKETVLCMPTTNCLVSLTSIPPYVLALDDVERVSFERVNFSLKNFDLIFIFKDYARKVESIGAIEQKSLEDIKEWLTDNLDIPYHESPGNLDWTKIMRAITDDPQGFISGGGWNFLAEGGSDEEAGDDDEESEEFEPSDLDDSEDESEDFSESDSSSSDSGSGSDDLGSDESEGLDWDELEAKAKKDDNEASKRSFDGGAENTRGGASSSNSSKRKGAPQPRHRPSSGSSSNSKRQKRR